MASTSSPSARVLLNKCKVTAAAYVHSECVNNKADSLNELLDILLDPSKEIDDLETINWIKALMAGGMTDDEFEKTVRSYDNATTCGLVWTPNFVAYRCRTCGISPCMSLCTECFKKGNHYRHDFNMFLSQAGGACDCGDTSVMKETGFCDKHGPKAAVKKSDAPSDLMCVAEAMMPRIILRLIQHLRENGKPGVAIHKNAINDVDAYLTMLLDLNNMGALMRNVMTSALTNPQKYRGLMDPLAFAGKTEYDSYCQDSNKIYQDAVKSLPNPEPPDEYKECASLQEHLVHTTFLEELMFWTVAYEFPQKLVCLLLHMLPDPDYKEALTRAFVLHYSRISMMLERSTDPDTLSNRVVHVSVQLFSNKDLALRMVDQLKLLHVMVISLKYMMSKILIQNTLHDPDKNFHYVVDCGRQVMKEHCYWPLVSDLNNVLSHKPVAERFMSDDTLLEMWFEFLSLFQGMNVNQRELSQHVEFESNTYYAAFSAELEASSYPMWQLVSHLHGPESAELSKRVLNFCHEALRDWLDAVNFTDPNVSDSLQVSFHVPLHRYYAVFMCQAIRQQGEKLDDLLPPTDMLHLLMMHPLRIQVAFYEILNGLWVRNGLQIKGQAMTYIQCNFCNSMVDADLYLLQICATKLPANDFLQTVIEKFHVRDWMSLIMYHIPQTEYREGEHDIPMLESCLTFLATLVSTRTNLGLSDPEMSRLEMVTLLCMSDKTHSQLMELMPERCGTTQNRDFESVLAEVAQYRAPTLELSGNIMQQGMYGPKPKVWDELYDPLHVLLRAVHRRDFQVSMDRFTEHVKQTNKCKTTPWPPFRHPAPVSPDYEDPRKVLRSKVFHAMVFVILQKAVYGHNVSEQVLALTIYLLEMAVMTAEVPNKSDNPLCHYGSNESPRVIHDMDLASFFDTNDLSANLRTVIPRVVVSQDQKTNVTTTNSFLVEELEWDGNGEMPQIIMLNDDGAEEPQSSILALPLVAFSGEQTGDSSAVSTSIVPAIPTTSDEYVMDILPEDGVVAIPQSSNENESMSHRVLNSTASQGLPPALPTAIISATRSVELAVESSASSRSSSSRPALPPTPQRPAVMAGNEIVSANMNFNQSSSSDLTTEFAPFKHYRSRGPQSTSCQPQSMRIDESMISLLLKLHSQLSGVPDSYNPEPRQSESEMETDTGSSSTGEQPLSESRIGDGPFFIGQLLNKIAKLDPMCRDTVLETRNTLWPKMRNYEDEQREKELQEKEEKRRRAKERQQKLLEEYANKQRQFMENAMETDEAGMSGMDWEQGEGPATLVSKKEYDCVICNQTTPSTEDKPMGLIVLLQPTSVLAHQREESERLMLPTSDTDPPIPKQGTRLSNFNARTNRFNTHFDNNAWLLTVNTGWEGGIHVQTCGHHLHLDCLKSYLQSLRSQQRQQSLAVETGEYLCPFCRQTANSVLPLSPKMGDRSAMVKAKQTSMARLITELNVFLKEMEKYPVSNLSVAMGKAMEDIMGCCSPSKFMPSHQSFFLFVTSVARTNFEIELVQRGNSLCAPHSTQLIPKRDCMVALLHVLAVHSKVLASWSTHNVWQQLTNVPVENTSNRAVTLLSKDVPLLLIDPTCLLIQFILLLPLHLDRIYFSTVVKVLYNLLYYQVLLQLSCELTPSERESIKQLAASPVRAKVSSRPFLTALNSVIDFFESTQLYEKSEESTSGQKSNWELIDNLQERAKVLCLPFLRISSLMRYHLYEQELPQIAKPEHEFESLAMYLDITCQWQHASKSWNISDLFDVTKATPWISEEDHMVVPMSWFVQLAVFIEKSPDDARALTRSHHIAWKMPKLLGLPREYEKIFTYYHKRQCSECKSVPKDISICLLCGTIVCLKQSCCKQSNVCETVRHSIECGGGTGIFLEVTSTYIIIVCGRRACLWGSLFLDDFAEEDRDLKRGKPLYLSPGRYQLLEQQWLSHRFTHTQKNWVYHRDAL